jgi:hypothetical protein
MKANRRRLQTHPNRNHEPNDTSFVPALKHAENSTGLSTLYRPARQRLLTDALQR